MNKEKKLNVYSTQSINDNDREELFYHIIDKITKVTNTKKRIEVISNNEVVTISRCDEKNDLKPI